MKLHQENPLIINNAGRSAKLKRQPLYFHQLSGYPITSPIFMAVDGSSLNCLHRFNSVCLFCHKSSDSYDLSFCYGREVWVFYADSKKLALAMQLARAVQLAGATKTFVILLDTQLVQRKAYAK